MTQYSYYANEELSYWNADKILVSNSTELSDVDFREVRVIVFDKNCVVTLEQLPYMPNLIYLERLPPRVEVLQTLPSLKLLELTEHEYKCNLRHIKSQPLLEYINVYNLPDLTNIDSLSNRIFRNTESFSVEYTGPIFEIGECPSLQFVGMMPTSTYCYITSCPEMTYYPYLPLAKIVDISNTGVRKVNSLHRTRGFTCNGTRVEELPRSQNLFDLKCNKTLITSIRGMPELTSLHALDTPLQKLPRCPKLNSIRANGQFDGITIQQYRELLSQNSPLIEDD